MKQRGVTCRKIENSGVHASGGFPLAPFYLSRNVAMAADGACITGSTYIEFDDVEVPVSNLLGQENNGFEIIMSSMSIRPHHKQVILPYDVQPEQQPLKTFWNSLTCVSLLQTSTTNASG